MYAKLISKGDGLNKNYIYIYIYSNTGIRRSVCKQRVLNYIVMNRVNNWTQKQLETNVWLGIWVLLVLCTYRSKVTQGPC